MENIRPIGYGEIIKRDWRKVAFIILILVLLALVLTLVQPFLYRATVSIFVVQKSSFSIDAYSASKSEERIANKLGQVVLSSSFLEKVLYSGFDIDKNYFPSDEYKRRQKWSKIVKTDVPAGLSKLEIEIYHKDPQQALQIANAVSYTLTQQKREFIGIDDIDLKILDSPLVSKYPMKPNVVLNLLLGLVLGFVVGIAYVIVSYDPEKDKLFGAPNIATEPHLISYNNIPADESVEQDIASEDNVPEIENLEEVEELEEAEEDPNKPAEFEQNASEGDDFSLPDLAEEIESDELESDDLGEEDEKLVPPAIPGARNDSVDFDNDNKKRLPNFEGEDEFVGMSRKQ